MHDFWKSSGYHLLRRTVDGRLAVTDDFLRAYLRRPELNPVGESCANEIALHQALLDDPRQTVEPARIEAMEDADMRDNYRVILGFRDALVESETLETCYLGLFGSGRVRIPPLFIDHMAHAIARNMLDGCDDPMRLRAAELLFRSQKAMVEDGAILLADEDTVDMHAAGGGYGNLGRLLAENNTPTASVDLDVLGEDNSALYWQRDDRYDMVLDASFGRPGMIALCWVLEAWVRHFWGAEVSIEPVGMIRDERWAWHIGLEAESSAILNDLYDGNDVGEDRMARLLSLYRLTFRDPAQMRPEVAGKPVYLGLAMDTDSIVRLKPQNLLLNLPLAEAS